MSNRISYSGGYFLRFIGFGLLSFIGIHGYLLHSYGNKLAEKGIGLYRLLEIDNQAMLIHKHLFLETSVVVLGCLLSLFVHYMKIDKQGNIIFRNYLNKVSFSLSLLKTIELEKKEIESTKQVTVGWVNDVTGQFVKGENKPKDLRMPDPEGRHYSTGEPIIITAHWSRQTETRPCLINDYNLYCYDKDNKLLATIMGGKYNGSLIDIVNKIRDYGSKHHLEFEINT
ncbi:hypothetical protein [Helicobacter cetorum]|uniref:hypothetical protein n=1 Tax=Helicobacter cetorum TaxID=138563 RepID=UPI000CF16043|nr:hypothetical protein [Helicobacter cetorum]